MTACGKYGRSTSKSDMINNELENKKLGGILQIAQRLKPWFELLNAA